MINNNNNSNKNTAYALVYDVHLNFNKHHATSPPSLSPSLSKSNVISEKAPLDSSIKWIEEELNTVYRHSNAPLC